MKDKARQDKKVNFEQFPRPVRADLFWMNGKTMPISQNESQQAVQTRIPVSKNGKKGKKRQCNEDNVDNAEEKRIKQWGLEQEQEDEQYQQNKTRQSETS
jgi:hypothetical protein